MGQPLLFLLHSLLFSPGVESVDPRALKISWDNLCCFSCTASSSPRSLKISWDNLCCFSCTASSSHRALKISWDNLCCFSCTASSSQLALDDVESVDPRALNISWD